MFLVPLIGTNFLDKDLRIEDNQVYEKLLWYWHTKFTKYQKWHYLDNIFKYIEQKNSPYCFLLCGWRSSVTISFQKQNPALII